VAREVYFKNVKNFICGPADRWKAAGANAVALCKFACENWSFENAKALATLQRVGQNPQGARINCFWGRSGCGCGCGCGLWAGNWWAASFECNCGGKLTFYEAENKGKRGIVGYRAYTTPPKPPNSWLEQTRSGQKAEDLRLLFWRQARELRGHSGWSSNLEIKKIIPILSIDMLLI